MACVEDNVRDALSVGHALTLCNALIKSCCPVALLCGRTDLAQRYVELLLQHTSAHPLFMWHPIGRCYQGLLRLAQGELDGGRQAVRQRARRAAAGALRLPADLGLLGAGAGRCAGRRGRAGPGDHRAGHRAGAPRRRALVLARTAARARRGAAAARRRRVARRGARGLRAGAGAGARERRAGLGAARAGQPGFAGRDSTRRTRRAARVARAEQHFTRLCTQRAVPPEDAATPGDFEELPCKTRSACWSATSTR